MRKEESKWKLYQTWLSFASLHRWSEFWNIQNAILNLRVAIYNNHHGLRHPLSFSWGEERREERSTCVFWLCDIGCRWLVCVWCWCGAVSSMRWDQPTVVSPTYLHTVATSPQTPSGLDWPDIPSNKPSLDFTVLFPSIGADAGVWRQRERKRVIDWGTNPPTTNYNLTQSVPSDL